MKKIIAFLLVINLSLVPVFGLETRTLIPVGKTAGIKILCDGVMVSGVTQIATKDGPRYPAKDAGIKQGDIIKKVDEIEVLSNEHLAELIQNKNEVLVMYERDGKIFKTIVTTAQDENDNLKKIGIWVRDSMAGIGTVTYIDPETLEYGALGHSISEIDSGKIMPVKQGELIFASVSGVTKGIAGIPGELSGKFDLTREIGDIKLNSETGIYGIIDDQRYINISQALETMPVSEVKTGPAYILSNVYSDTVLDYQIEITKVNEEGLKNFTIKIVDPKLIDQTGGIVQGMSGSPIIQNGKIIGAVTHVLVNNPTEGYGVSIQNMLDNAA